MVKFRNNYVVPEEKVPFNECKVRKDTFFVLWKKIIEVMIT